MKQDQQDSNRAATPPPTVTQREAAKSRILNAVSGWLEARITEVFEMADEGIDEICWDDLEEVREQICGCVADDLHYDLGEAVQAILAKSLSAKVR